MFDIQTYAASLYQRRNEGVILAPADTGIGDWRPAPHMCHLNVDTLCSNAKDFQAVRGWLVFDFYLFYRFTAHSVVRADGALYDITPSLTSRQYPFVRADFTGRSVRRSDRRVSDCTSGLLHRNG